MALALAHKVLLLTTSTNLACHTQAPHADRQPQHIAAAALSLRIIKTFSRLNDPHTFEQEAQHTRQSFTLQYHCCGRALTQGPPC